MSKGKIPYSKASTRFLYLQSCEHVLPSLAGHSLIPLALAGHHLCFDNCKPTKILDFQMESILRGQFICQLYR